MIKVNEQKCIKCYKCVNVCPFTVLGKENGFPALRKGKMCIRCMHCAAACPQDAITYKGEQAALKNVETLSESFAADLEKHVLQRRSYRHFQEKPVDRELLTHILELADWAPSAKNQHPHSWIVIDSKETIKAIMDAIVEYSKETGVSPEVVTELENENNNVVMGTASTLILCHADSKAINAPADSAIAMTTVELLLQANGIGTCWGGYLTRMCNAVPALKEILPEIPENHSYFGAFMAGYPEKEDYLYVPERLKRADIKFL
jgi:nitroreductase/NAD-dependent dihydropyrimidine dehydrogenase PreA subunit